MFTLPIMNKIISNVYNSRIDDWHVLQIVDFAFDCITNLPQIENFSSDNSFCSKPLATRCAIKWGWHLIGWVVLHPSLMWSRVFVTRNFPYFELVVEKINQFFFNDQGLFMGESHIEMMIYLYSSLCFWKKIYIMFTLPILNKVSGNVYDSRTETINMHFR